jgi:hypothetical protein
LPLGTALMAFTIRRVDPVIFLYNNKNGFKMSIFETTAFGSFFIGGII